MFAQTPESRTLCRLGLCSLGLYSILAVFFWTAWSFKAHWIDEAVIVVATGALATLYFYGLKFARRAATSTIVIFAIFVGAIGFLTPPFDSTDKDPMIQNAWIARLRKISFSTSEGAMAIRRPTVCRGLFEALFHAPS